MTRLEVQSRLKAAWENGSEQQSEKGNDLICRPPSSTFFSNGSCLMLWKNRMERLTKEAEILRICRLPIAKSNLFQPTLGTFTLVLAIFGDIIGLPHMNLQ